MGSNDRALAAWVDLQLIAEAAHEMTPPNRESSGLRELEACFESWASALDTDLLNGSLLIYYLYLRAKLYEMALRPAQQQEEMIPPFLPEPDERMARMPRNVSVPPSASTAQGIRSFVLGCYTTLLAFIRVRLETLRFCPAVTFVRAVYAVKGLAMLRNGLLQSSMGQRDQTYDEVLRLARERLDLLVRQYGSKVPMMVRGLFEKLTADLPPATAPNRAEVLRPSSSNSYPTPPEMSMSVDQPQDMGWEEGSFNDWNFPLDETLLQSLDFDMLNPGVFGSMESGDFDISTLGASASHASDPVYWNIAHPATDEWGF